MTLADHILGFLQQLRLPGPLPPGIGVLNPYQEETAFGLCQQFYQKYYSDRQERLFMLGINPGRFGGGLTGIPFTDPVKLENVCGITNRLPKKTELSADFIHEVISGFGGVQKFFSSFYINSVSPLGFVKDGKNINYYDVPELARSLDGFIRDSIRHQLTWGLRRDVAFCIGEGTNLKYLHKLNQEEKYFDRIIPLAHPRFIMQYRRKQVPRYISDYLEKVTSVL